MIARSLSDKRILVKVQVNEKDGVMLLDTGASLSMIDESKSGYYGFRKGVKFAGTIQGAGGEISAYHAKNLMVNLEGIAMYQFITADISSIVASIRRETGITVCGIIGLPQMKAAEIKIYPANGIIKIGY